VGGHLAGGGCAFADGNREWSLDEGAWLEDFTVRSSVSATGIQFVHEVETSARYLLSESVGSGGEKFEFDNDGRLEVHLIYNATLPRVRPAAFKAVNVVIWL